MTVVQRLKEEMKVLYGHYIGSDVISPEDGLTS